MCDLLMGTRYLRVNKLLHETINKAIGKIKCSIENSNLTGYVKGEQLILITNCSALTYPVKQQ